MSFTQRVMQDYGKAWYGFDGNSRKIIDKLERHNSALIAKAGTKPYYGNGWNGKGFSAQCTNGSVFSVANPVSQERLWTVRFKFKIEKRHNTNGGTILSNMDAPYMTHYKIGMGVNGRIHFEFFVDRYTTFNYYSEKSYDDGKWHDLVFSMMYDFNYNMAIYWTIDDIERFDTTQRATYNVNSNDVLYVMGANLDTPFNGIQVDDLVFLALYINPYDAPHFFNTHHFSLDIEGEDKFKTTNKAGIKYSTGHGRLGLNRIDNAGTINPDMYGILREIDQAIDADAINLQEKYLKWTSTSNRWTNAMVNSNYSAMELPLHRGHLIGSRPTIEDPWASSVKVALKYKGKTYRIEEIRGNRVAWTYMRDGYPQYSDFVDFEILDNTQSRVNMLYQFESQADFDPFDAILVVLGTPSNQANPPEEVFYQLTFDYSPLDQWAMSFADFAGYQDFTFNVYSTENISTFSASVNNKNLTPQLAMQKDPITLPVPNNEMYVVSAIGLARWGITFDNGTTWETFKNDAFETITSPEFGSQLSALRPITIEQWKSKIIGKSGMKFGYWLADASSYVSEVIILGSTDGSETVADTSKYKIAYDDNVKTATVKFSQSGIYRLNYFDHISPIIGKDDDEENTEEGSR